MRCKESYYRRYAEKRAEREKNSANRWQSKIKDPITIFTGVLALGTIALAIIAVLQWCTLEKTDRTLKDTLATNKSTVRAYVFLEVLKVDSISPGGPFIISARWKNIGKTPAIVKRIRYHFLVLRMGDAQDRTAEFTISNAHPLPSGQIVAGDGHSKIVEFPSTKLIPFPLPENMLKTGDFFGQYVYEDPLGDHVQCFGFGVPIPLNAEIADYGASFGCPGKNN